jgi:hypothetical protein
MASARELLEQADALMRRNRGRSSPDIPVLTDVVTSVPANDERDEDVPVLTDAVAAAVVAPTQMPPVHAEAGEELAEPVEAEKPAPAPAPPRSDATAIMRSVEAIPVDLPMDGDASDWLVMDTIDPATHSITGAGPDTLAVVPPVTLKDAVPEPPPAEAVPAVVVDEAAERAAKAAADEAKAAAEEAKAAAEEAKAAAEEERWRALAEQVSMQVLQRVDLFTDTGLKTQLAEHLQPIVERASAELVRAITDHVGGVLRTYVAEAIEREIAQWRREH